MAREIVAAESLDELKQRVDDWYAKAAAAGRTDVRLQWDESAVKKTDSGFYEFEVWAE
jgi:hypothetical protein